NSGQWPRNGVKQAVFGPSPESAPPRGQQSFPVGQSAFEVQPVERKWMPGGSGAFGAAARPARESAAGTVAEAAGAWGVAAKAGAMAKTAQNAARIRTEAKRCGWRISESPES